MKTRPAAPTAWWLKAWRAWSGAVLSGAYRSRSGWMAATCSCAVHAAVIFCHGGDLVDKALQT